MKHLRRIVPALALGLVLAVPFAHAASGGLDTSYLQGYADSIINFINDYLVDTLVAVAFLTFLWGVYKYFILGADSPDKRKEGAQFVLWGVIGFVIIMTLWGLVSIVSDTLNLSPGGSAASHNITPPTL